MADQESRGVLVYVGAYTEREPFVHGKATGISILRFDPVNGLLRQESITTGDVNPTFLALHPSRRFLYATNEVYTSAGGAVSAYAIDAESGSLTLINRRPSHGGAPCHLSVAGGGRSLLVANYQTGNIAIFPLAHDGHPEAVSDVAQHVGSSIHSERQQGPHAHSVTPAPNGDVALVCDLGIDRILAYRLDHDRGRLLPHEPHATPVRPGAGPRHLDFHPGGRWVYVINELDSTVNAFAFDPDAGSLHLLQTVSTLPDGFVGENTTADIHVHPSGKYVYGSNRGHDSIAGFAVDEQTGRLTSLGQTLSQGRTPRNFAIDATGSWLLAANQDSDSIVTFRVDPGRGTLEAVGRLAVLTPVCVRLLQL